MADLGKRALLTAASVVVSLVLAEVLVGLAWQNPFTTEGTDHIVKLEMHHPNRDLPVDRSQVTPDDPVGRLRTDARSYIEPASAVPDPQLTIAFLGGSTTECGALDEDKRFPARVVQLLRERGVRARALNIARAGNTAHDSVNVLLNHVVEDQPDIALMMHAANDIGVLSEEGSYDSRNGGASTQTVAARWLMQAASRRSDLAGALRWFATMAPPPAGDFAGRAVIARERMEVPSAPFVARLRAFVGIARAFDIEPVLMTQPAISVRVAGMPDWIDARNQEIFNQLIREVAGEESATLIDLSAHVLEVEGWDQPGVVFYDGIHVTDGGAAIYALYIAQHLMESVIPGRIPMLASVRSR